MECLPVNVEESPLKRHGIHEASIIKFRPERCPHCNVARPQMLKKWDHQQEISHSEQFYVAYQCTSCDNIIIAKIKTKYPTNSLFPNPDLQTMVDYWPKLSGELSPTIPEAARTYLAEARNGINNPNSSVVASATAVELMLQNKK